MTAREPLVAGLRAVEPLLAGPALEVAARLGEITEGEPGDRLVLVAPSDRRWRRARVLADAEGAAAAVVLELPGAVDVPVSVLAAELGDPAEEWPQDARAPRYVFRASGLPCAVEVTVRRASAGRGWVADAIELSRR